MVLRRVVRPGHDHVRILANTRLQIHIPFCTSADIVPGPGLWTSSLSPSLTAQQITSATATNFAAVKGSAFPFHTGTIIDRAKPLPAFSARVALPLTSLSSRAPFLFAPPSRLSYLRYGHRRKITTPRFFSAIRPTSCLCTLGRYTRSITTQCTTTSPAIPATVESTLSGVSNDVTPVADSWCGTAVYSTRRMGGAKLPEST